MSELSITKYFPFTRVKIIKQNVHHKDASSALIYIEPDMRYSPLCHKCASKAATVHSKNHIRLIRDLNIANAQVFLQLSYRKIWCDECGGVRVEQMTFVDVGQRVTNRLARYIHDLCKMLTVKDVAKHLDIDPKTVKDIDKSFLEKSFGKDSFDDLRVLMIDEIAVHRGHRYMTTSRRLMLSSKTLQTARNVLLKLWRWTCGNRILTVSIIIVLMQKLYLTFSMWCRASTGLLIMSGEANILRPEEKTERFSRAAVICS